MGESFDLIILGGGAGGFAAAVKADEMGAKTLLINSGLPIGGTCVNVGCVPSKRLLWMAEIIHFVKNRSFDGIEKELKAFDFSKIIQSELELVEKMRDKKYKEVIKDFKNVEFVEGYARFVSKDQIESQ